jgi:hypothetical protein
MSLCIPKELIAKVKDIVSDKGISSIERLKRLSDMFGDNKVAQDINLLYEKSLFLKNQEKAIDNFINKINGVNAEKRAKLREAFAENRTKRNTKINDEELVSIVKDIYDRKYDLDIKPEDVQSIAKFKAESDALKPKMENTPVGSPERLAYGRKVVDLQGVLDSVINPEQGAGFLKTLGFEVKSFKERVQNQSNLLDKTLEVLSSSSDVITSGVYKSINAAVDISFMLRQGMKVLARNPRIWAEQMKNALRPVANMTNRVKQDVILREFKASLVSHPLYDVAMKSKLAVGVIEEFFPTTLAEKIPLIGNLFKASDISFTMFAQGTRMSLFETAYNNFVKSTGRIPPPEVTSGFAKVVNSISGRGSLGRLESVSGVLNKMFFSARWVKSQADTFIMPFRRGLPKEVRMEALKSSASTFATIGSLMYAASFFTEVSTDTTSSNFGKAKVPGSKDTWVDLTAGLGSWIILASRLANGKTTNSQGKVTELNTGKFGSMTYWDLGLNFVSGKASPVLSQVISHAKGRYISGGTPTIPQSALNLISPISIENAYEMFTNEKAAVAMMTTVFDILGLSTINYEQYRSKK